MPLKHHPLDAWERVRPVEDFEQPLREMPPLSGPVYWVKIVTYLGVVMCGGMLIWSVWS